MQELGDLLREARIEKGLTLEEVENLTKIRKRYLEAIEEGDYKVLPGPFYVRAFVKSYAETVGLNADQVLRIYRHVIPDPGLQAEAEIYPVKRRRRSVNTEKWSKAASTLVLICFIIVVISVIYYYQTQNADPRGDIDENIPITQSEDYIGQDDDSLEEQAADPDPQPLPKPEPDPQPQAQEPVLAKVGVENGVDIYVLKNADKIFVRMESETSDCWYDIYEGGYKEDRVDTGTLKTGESKNYEFSTAGHFHLGFAKTIKLTVNGIEFKPSENEGPFHLIIQLEEDPSTT